MEKWQVLSSSYLLQSPYGNIRQDRCLLPNGSIIENYVVHEYVGWVNVVAITKDGSVVLVRHYRHGYQDLFIEIPGGAMEEGETAAETIVRELREETGYISDQAPLLLGAFATNPALATNRVKTFLLLDAYRASEQSLDATEEMEVLLIPFARVGEMIRQGEISQIFTVAAYYAAKERLEGGATH